MVSTIIIILVLCILTPEVESYKRYEIYNSYICVKYAIIYAIYNTRISGRYAPFLLAPAKG